MSIPEILSEQISVKCGSRREVLLQTGKATPRFLQGVYPFAGRDIYATIPLHDDVVYTVPKDFSAELTYVRAGNSSEELIYIVICANDVPLRYFPLGPKSHAHVELAVVTFPWMIFKQKV